MANNNPGETGDCRIIEINKANKRGVKTIIIAFRAIFPIYIY